MGNMAAKNDNNKSLSYGTEGICTIRDAMEVQPYPHRCVLNLGIFHLLTESLKLTPSSCPTLLCSIAANSSFPPAIASPFPYGSQLAHPPIPSGITQQGNRLDYKRGKPVSTLF